MGYWHGETDGGLMVAERKNQGLARLLLRMMYASPNGWETGG